MAFSRLSSEYDARTFFGFGGIPVDKIIIIYSNVTEMFMFVIE